MYDELTKKDIEKMKEEIEYRKLVVRKEALEAGMNGHIAKPIDIPKLMELLGEILT